MSAVWRAFYFSHQQCWMAALMKLCPATSASFLCPCPCVCGSGGGGDGDGLCPGPGLDLALQRPGPDWAVPGCTPPACLPVGSAAGSRRMQIV